MLNVLPRNLKSTRSVNCSTGVVAVRVAIPLEFVSYVLPGAFLACNVKVTLGLPVLLVDPLKLTSGISCLIKLN